MNRMRLAARSSGVSPAFAESGLNSALIIFNLSLKHPFLAALHRPQATQKRKKTSAGEALAALKKRSDLSSLLFACTFRRRLLELRILFHIRIQTHLIRGDREGVPLVHWSLAYLEPLFVQEISIP